MVSEQLSVRAVEDAVKARNELGRDRRAGAGSPPAPKLRPPGVLELEELLSAHLDTRVRSNLGAKGVG